MALHLLRTGTAAALKHRALAGPHFTSRSFHLAKGGLTGVSSLPTHSIPRSGFPPGGHTLLSPSSIHTSPPLAPASPPSSGAGTGPKQHTLVIQLLQEAIWLFSELIKAVAALPQVRVRGSQVLQDSRLRWLRHRVPLRPVSPQLIKERIHAQERARLSRQTRMGSGRPDSKSNDDPVLSLEHRIFIPACTSYLLTHYPQLTATINTCIQYGMH
ncbi:hypothetical protein OC834_005540 [Tilletia horrida]|nr:hypothetical protein OC834_005540 [Tilletia horrida]